MNTSPRILFLFFAALIPGLIPAQVSTVSPYSRYGIGELLANPFAQNAGMGGFGTALQNDSLDPHFINFANPASFTSSRYTLFESGVLSQGVRLQNKTEKELTQNTSLSYISLAFPVSRWWGMGLGLVPYSSVGYDLIDKDTVDTQPVDYLYKGSGGINRLFFANAFRPFVAAKKNTFAYSLRNLSLGASASYLFGRLDNSREVIFPANSQYFNIRNKRTVRVNDFFADYGLLYSVLIDSVRSDSAIKKDLKEDVKLTWGLTVSPSSEIRSETDILTLSFIKTGFGYNYEIIKDTIEDRIDKTGTLRLPLSFGAGFAFRKGERWLAGIDFSLQKWSEFYFLGEPGNLKNSMRVSAGAQYIPNKKDAVHYFNRVQYRFGFRYLQTYLELRDTQLSEYAVSIGATFPTRWLLGQSIFINVALEAGSRGTTDNGLIREDFLRGSLGLTFNARWFDKRKYD